MKKMMFLALVLSVMAMGSVSANDAARKPGSFVVGFNGDGGFVKVDMVAPKPGKKPSCSCDFYHNPPRKDSKKHNGKRGDRFEMPRDKHPHACPYHGPHHRPGPSVNGGHPTPPPPAHSANPVRPSRPSGPVRPDGPVRR